MEAPSPSVGNGGVKFGTNSKGQGYQQAAQFEKASERLATQCAPAAHFAKCESSPKFSIWGELRVQARPSGRNPTIQRIDNTCDAAPGHFAVRPCQHSIGHNKRSNMTEAAADGASGAGALDLK